MSPLTRPFRLYGFAAILASGSCSSSSTAPAPAPDAFLGPWSCTFEAALTLTQPPLPTEYTRGSFTEQIVAGPSAGAIVVTSTTITGDAGGASDVVVCALNFTVSGGTATLAGTQTCPGQNGTTNTYSTGTLTTMDSDHWSAEVEFGVSGIDDVSRQALAGSVQFSAACARM